MHVRLTGHVGGRLLTNMCHSPAHSRASGSDIAAGRVLYGDGRSSPPHTPQCCPPAGQGGAGGAAHGRDEVGWRGTLGGCGAPEAAGDGRRC